jgi:hypothetical protein
VKVARITGASPREMKAYWPTVRAKFVQVEGRQLQNVRLEKERAKGNGKKPAASVSEEPPIAEYFEAWYLEYPRKEAKANGLKAYKQAVAVLTKRPHGAGPGADDPHGYLLSKVKLFAGSALGRAEKYCPLPASWLNAHRFDDDPRDWERRADQDPRGTKGAMQQYLLEDQHG